MQPDTIVPNPGDSQAYNRYMYTQGNPIKYNDPTGHDVGCAGYECGSLSSGVVRDVLQSAEAEDGEGLYLIRIAVEAEKYEFITYVHILNESGVMQGDVVEPGDYLGEYGNYGRTYDWPHLHVQFEKSYMKGLDPAEFWPGGKPNFIAPPEAPIE